MSSDDFRSKLKEALRLYGQRQYGQALAILDTLDQESPNNADIVFGRAKCMAGLGRTGEALELARYLEKLLGDPRGTALIERLAPRHEAVPPARKRAADGLPLFRIAGYGALVLGVAALVAVPLLAGRETTRGPVENPTYAEHVAPIFNENCVVCHRPGEAVPMTLDTYENIRPWVKSIRRMVETRQMPPWHADPSVGQFKNDRRLTDADITTVLNWVDQGARRGNPADEPAPLAFESGWKIGEPDVVLSMVVDEVLPPQLEDEYRYVILPTGFTQDRWIEAAEVKPGNIEVVHHVIIFTANWNDLMSGKAQDESGLGGSLGGYAPGSPPLLLEKGRGIKIQAGAALVLQMHYHKEPGTRETDNTTVGIRFARHRVDKEMRFGAVGTQRFSIPPHSPNFPVEARFAVKEDIHIEQLIPHMHVRGKNMKLWLELPTGDTQDLISVPNYDFNWQTFYELEKPISVKAGTELVAFAHYDNSENNPFNPNPNETVRWGLPTTAEMMYMFYMYTADDEDLGAYDPSAAGAS